jgi:hypothetical protein
MGRRTRARGVPTHTLRPARAEDPERHAFLRAYRSLQLLRRTTGRSQPTRQPSCSRAPSRRCPPAPYPLLACRAFIVTAPCMAHPAAAAHRAQARPSGAPPSRNRRIAAAQQALTPKPRPVSEQGTGSAGCVRARGRRAHGSTAGTGAPALGAKKMSTSRGIQGGNRHPGVVQLHRASPSSWAPGTRRQRGSWRG